MVFLLFAMKKNKKKEMQILFYLQVNNVKTISAFLFSSLSALEVESLKYTLTVSVFLLHPANKAILTASITKNDNTFFILSILSQLTFGYLNVMGIMIQNVLPTPSSLSTTMFPP